MVFEVSRLSLILELEISVWKWVLVGGKKSKNLTEIEQQWKTFSSTLLFIRIYIFFLFRPMLNILIFLPIIIKFIGVSLSRSVSGYIVHVFPPVRSRCHVKRHFSQKYRPVLPFRERNNFITLVLTYCILFTDFQRTKFYFYPGWVDYALAVRFNERYPEQRTCLSDRK